MKPLILEWKPYLIWHPSDVEVSVWSHGQWIMFEVWEEQIPYSLDTVFPHSMCGARMNRVTNVMKRDSVSILVPEHILSMIVMYSLMAWGWLRPDITIHVPNKKNKQHVFIPVLWPWIMCNHNKALQELVTSSLRPKSDVACFDNTHLVMNGNRTDAYFYFVSDKKIRQWREWTLKESNSCIARIEACVQSDVAATLQATSLPIQIDYENDWTAHFSARAMGRLTNILPYLWVKTWHKLGIFNWITSDSYFLVWPRHTPTSITKSMQSKYRTWFNEHAYHLWIADFPSELAALAASLGVDRIQAEFIMKNMTHHDRLMWLKKMKKDKLFRVDTQETI